MSEQHGAKAQKLAREKMLFRYCTALDRGDFDVIADVLRGAEDDPELARMISEANMAYATENELMDLTVQADAIQQLLAQHFPDSTFEAEATEPPPITISDVAARLQSDSALKGGLERDAQAAISRLHETQDTLPADLSPRAVQELFGRLGLQVSRRFQDVFRRTAMYLKIGREQSVASLAAARRQKHPRRERRPRTDGRKNARK